MMWTCRSPNRLTHIGIPRPIAKAALLSLNWRCERSIDAACKTWLAHNFSQLLSRLRKLLLEVSLTLDHHNWVIACCPGWIDWLHFFLKNPVYKSKCFDPTTLHRSQSLPTPVLEGHFAWVKGTETLPNMGACNYMPFLCHTSNLEALFKITFSRLHFLVSSGSHERKPTCPKCKTRTKYTPREARS